ncbi:DUF5906 domain-containing protein [Undibacterium sp. MH2W]|uniref:DUF5906 domain-containing protein n=1 Tax=Undibacterium sp. MH2W TaxID=3413044 RepID=UPI003BF051EC
MTTASQVVEQMASAGLPPLPAGHPILDGKYKRFGPQKKAWYILREMTLKSGRNVVTGAFGFFQGENRNTIPVKVDAEEMTEADRAEYVRKQREYEKKERADREREIDLAANRAKNQWADARDVETSHPHEYLIKKRVPPYGVRENDRGQLLIPMWSEGGAGTRLMGCQKIDATGQKLYNKGMDKIGVGFSYGLDASDLSVIAIGEGYATCASVRLATGLPFVAAFDAGNLIHVARQLRKNYPKSHLLFLADDDYLLLPRFIERLREEFNVAGCASIAIDGESHDVVANDGETVSVTAWWRADANGIKYIEADMRKGRISRHYTYKNAGVSLCTAAAKEVGNASVVTPLFADRNGEKWTDFNDLHVEQSLGAVSSQINAAIAALNSDSPLPPSSRSTDFSNAPPRPLGEAEKISASQAKQGEEKIICSEAGAPRSNEIANVLSESEPDVGMAAFSLERILATHALVLGSTDVWDAVNQLRFKKAAFVAAVGKETYTHWLSSPERLSITLKDDDKKPASAKGGKGANSKFDGEYWDKVERLINNFTLIYGSDEVFDGERREIIKINPLRLAFTNDVVKAWLNFKDRKMVPREMVVFDPTYSVDPKKSLNLFDGFAMKPKQGSCDLILALLSYLCGDDEVAEWILCWLAYPLQNPGAKMASAIIMHGDEGSGKNLFFEKCIKSIYGKYAGVIGNQEIESQFNEWASQKLFMVCDEVVTRAEMRQMKGRLKQITANETISINPKNLSQREERNHINFAFLSNETQPLALDKSDRRYLVVWTPPKQSAEFYRQVADQMENGGNEAFYHFLLNLDIGDFNPHTKPIMTEAKRDLIELGLSPSERFFHDWSSQNIPIPFVSCTAQQLYDAFLRWCTLHGERFPPSQSKFGRDLKRVAGSQMQTSPVNVTFGASKRQLVCYWVGDPPEGKSREAWINASSALFEKDLDAYRRTRMDTNASTD